MDEIEEEIKIYQKTYFSFDIFRQSIIKEDQQRIKSSVIDFILDELLSNKDNKKIPYNKTFGKGPLYRARIIKDVDFSDCSNNGLSRAKIDDKLGKIRYYGFDKINSQEPLSSTKYSSNGRNNSKGISYLYLAEDKYTACAEVKPSINQFVSIATFRVQKDLDLIDFGIRNKDEELNKLISELESYPLKKENLNIAFLFSLIMSEFCKPVYCDQDYCVSQYISEKIQKAGYDGIRYRSSQVVGNNITLFHSSPSYIRYKNSTVSFIAERTLKIAELDCKQLLKQNPDVPEFKLEDIHYENIRSEYIKKLRSMKWVH